MSMEDDDDVSLSRRAAKIAMLEGVPEDEAEDERDNPDDEIGQARIIEARMPLADSLQQKTSLRANKWNELNRIARFARINPPTVLQGVIGGQQFVTVTGDSFNASGRSPEIQVANWGGEDSETLPITVTIAPVQQLNQLPPASFLLAARPYGIVQFGTRGFLVRAEVDIGTGCQFTISGSSVTVQVGFEYPTNIVVPVGITQVAQMILAGMLSFMPVVRTAPLTRTRYAVTGNSVPANIPVPAFAKSFTVWRPDPTIPLTITMLDGNGFFYVVNLAANEYRAVMPIMLATNITTVRLLQVPPSAGTIHVIFELAL